MGRLGVSAAVVDGDLVAGDVAVEDGRVVGVGLGRRGNGVAVPGLVDLQVNGYAGIDLLHAPERADEVADALARAGTTTWQPTLVTSAPERTVDAIARLAGARGSVGVHLEGPFLSPARSGAHERALLRDPDIDLLRALLDPGGVTSMTLASELPGALELIDELVSRGVVVSLGHSEATSEEAAAAAARGASTVTHLFNAMRPFDHREPGLAGFALGRSVLSVQLIADGVHVADDVILLAWAAAHGRLALVSDATAAAGQPDGTYRLGASAIAVDGGVARLADGTLAGSTASLLDGVRRLHALGVPLADAVTAATAVPARIVRRPDLGRLEPCATADVLVLDDGLEPTLVLRGGAVVE